MIDFNTISQCIIAVASSWLGVAETPEEGVTQQIESWQRTGGIYSRPDEPDLAWGALFVNAIAHDCLAERVHDGWTGTGAPYGHRAADWTSDQWLPSSPHRTYAELQPGDIVVYGSPTSPRVGVYAAPWGSSGLVIAGDVADAVRLTAVSPSAFLDARTLVWFAGYPD